MPKHYVEEAEEIRSHLVFLRGGAPFLSPSDALLLVQWLDEGMSADVILHALECAAERRRKSPFKRRLSLSHAKRYLGKELQVNPVQISDKCHPFTGVCVDQMLLSRLVSLPVGGNLALQGLSCFREYVQEVWSEMSENEREKLRAEAAIDLQDLLRGVDESTAGALVDEAARDLLRSRWPHCTLATFSHLVEAFDE